MKKLLFLFLIISQYSIAQIVGSCTTCPPSGVGNTGKALISNGSKKAVWGTISGLDTNAVSIDSLPYWSLTGNSGTTSANFIGTTDGQPVYMSSDSFVSMNAGNFYSKYGKNITDLDGVSFLSGYKEYTNPSLGVYGGTWVVNQTVDGQLFPYIITASHDSIRGIDSRSECGAGQYEIEVTIPNEYNTASFDVGNIKLTSYGFDAGPYQKTSWFDVNWQAGYFYLGSKFDHQTTIYGDTSIRKLTAVSDSGFVFKNLPNASDLGESDSLTIKLNGSAFISTNLSEIQFGNGITFFGADSATIYALTPTAGTTYYCNNCSGNGVTGRIVSYFGSLWRRLSFD